MMRYLMLAAALCASAADARKPERAGADRAIAAGPTVTPERLAELQKPASSVLFWSQERRREGFAHMEATFPGHVVRSGPLSAVFVLGKPLAVDPALVDAHMRKWNTAGIIVLKDGKVVLERYGQGLTQAGRWTSFSVAKSFTSTLVGAALGDGYITSLDDPVTRYIPELAGGGYDGVTVRQLLTMTSGVRWNEDYTDPNSDVAKMLTVKTEPDEDATVAYMRRLPREAAPGTKWVYKTGETNLIGVLVHRATGRVLSNYLSQKVFQPAGLSDGFWMTDAKGQEVSGCCLSMQLRDYALMGEFALAGGDRGIAKGWFADATAPHVATGAGPGFGYGYQWWTYPGGLYGARGIFGQSITVDPKRHVVVAILSNWPKASDPAQSAANLAFVQQLMAASD